MKKTTRIFPIPTIRAWYLKLGGIWIEPGENGILHANSDVILRPTQLVSSTSENEETLNQAMHTYGQATQRAAPVINPDSTPIKEFTLEQIQIGITNLLLIPIPLESNIIFENNLCLLTGQGFSIHVKNVSKKQCYLQSVILGPSRIEN